MPPLGRTILVALGLLLAAGSPDAAAQQVSPDLILHDAHVVTVDEAFSVTEAVAVRDGRFTAVGTDQQVLARAGPDTRVVDMEGRTVLPGFHDPNQNMVGRAVSFYPYQVNLVGAQSIDEIERAIAERVEQTEDGEWIFGSRGWWEYEMEEGRRPNRHDLDEVAPNNPVSIPGPHYDIVNSRALEILGIDEDTEDPTGGQIYRDSAGVPNGLLMDAAGQGLEQYEPEVSREAKLEGIRQMLDRLNGFGLTSVRNANGTKSHEELVRQLYEGDELTIRLDWTYTIDDSLLANGTEDDFDAYLESLAPPGAKWGGNMFRADAIVEVGLDGAERTALLRQSYPDRPGYHGLQLVSQEQLNTFAATAARRGWRLGTHAVGDAAVDQALEAFHYANERTPIEDRRWTIEHGFLLMPDHYQKVKDLGIIMNAHYMHNYLLGELILDAWERPLSDMSYRFRDWVEHGVMLANGSDGPISYPGRPILFIYGAVTRQTAWGGSLGPDQGLSREEAIRTVTINPAHISFEEHVKGSIEPGKLADFVVLSDDILAVAARDIRDIEVLTTVLGGEVVHGSLEP